jgi:hypothetical protein
MTDATPQPLPVVEDVAVPNGEADAVEHREHAIMNRRLDDDQV